MEPGRLSYRPALDGVRAVAVMLVFVFHAVPSALPGGFIGVDVFFVLSGYLITRLLVEERDAEGRVDLRRFYARRSRRLVPAIVLLVVVVAAVEDVWGSVLTASARLRESIATLFYAANWNLIATADDYFAEGVASPLRHAWSLAVEEQFYLVWPLLLLGLVVIAGRWWPARRRAGAVGITVLLATASAVAMALLFDPGRIARVYYGTDTRIFQPLLGAALGIVLANRPRQATRTRAWDAAAGGALAGIVVAALLLNGSDAAYYRGGAVIVGLLTVLLVTGVERAPTGWTTRALSLRPVVGLGVISYGFYLWHWPVLQWMTSPDGADFLQRRIVNIAQFALTLAVAVGSYRLVEDPIRRGQAQPLAWLGHRRTVAAGVVALGVAALAATALLRVPTETDPAVPLATGGTEATSDGLIVGAAGDEGTGVPTPKDASDTDLSRAAREDLALTAVADGSVQSCPEDPRPCVKVDAGPSAPVVALIGDSTAQAYDPALQQLARGRGFTYVQAAVGGCPIGHRLLATGIDGQRHKPSNHECFRELPGIYEEVVQRWSPQLVLATSSNEARPHVIDGEVIPPGTPEHRAETAARLQDMIDRFRAGGSQVAFIEVLPPGVGVTCLDRGQPSDPVCSRPTPEDWDARAYNDLLVEAADRTEGTVVVSLDDLVCGAAACPLMRDGIVLRYDGGHLTATASRALAPSLADRLAAAGAPLPSGASG